jgi:serine/threonine-protein kinase
VPLTTPSAVTTTQAPPPPVTVTAPPTVTVTAPPPAPPVPQDPDPTSLQQLRAQANIDYPVTATQAKNLWVPQLSSKWPGLFADGTQWDYASIWQEHQRLRLQYGAKLLWSGDWPNTFKNPDIWVTVAAFTFRYANGAREWCQNHGRDSDHCYPTQIQ